MAYLFCSKLINHVTALFVSIIIEKGCDKEYKLLLYRMKQEGMKHADNILG